MADATTLAALRYSDQHPGYSLAYAGEAAVPVSLLTIELLVQKRVELPLMDEYVLRLADQKISKVDAMAAVLGVDPPIITEAVVRQLSAETVEYRPDGLGEHAVVLTPGGRQALQDLSTITPMRIAHQRTFDRLRWNLTSHVRSDLVTRAYADTHGMVVMPSATSADIDTDDVKPRQLNSLLGNDNRSNDHPAIEVLSVEAVTRQPRLCLPAVLLVFASEAADDHRFNLVVDDAISEAHDTALGQIGGLERTRIRIERAIGEPELPADLRNRRAPSTVVLELKRRTEDSSSVRSGERSVESFDATSHGDNSARAQLDALTVRSVPVYEHRELLSKALETARTRFLVATPFVCDAVVTADFLSMLETMLHRPGLTAKVVYGLSRDPELGDSSALKQLHKMTRRFSRFTVAHVREPEPNVLIFDNAWVNSSFEWLSFRAQSVQTCRPEEGTLVLDEAHSSGRYDHYSRLAEHGDVSACG